MNLSGEETIQLKKLIKSNSVEDNTKDIQKHLISTKLRQDISIFHNIIQNYSHLSMEKVHDKIKTQCIFLHNVYPDILNKLIQNDPNQIKILYQMLDSLDLIEKKNKNQHEASVIVGKILKKEYIDKKI
jgi:hypothetical protein